MRCFSVLPRLLLGGAAVASAVPAGASGLPQAPAPSLPMVQPLPQNTDADRLASAVRRLGANPRDLYALIEAGELSVRLGDTTAAAALFKRAEAIDSRNGRVKAGIARILVNGEHPGEALRYFDLAQRYGVPPSVFADDRGLAYDLLGEQERAQRDYRLALATGESDEVRRRYALSLGISGRRDQALEQIDALLRRSDRGAWRARAFILAMSGDPAGANRIATSMMPTGMASGLAAFFTRLPSLPPGDRAFAVHFGQVTSTPARLADARMAPPLPPLGPDPYAPRPAPVQVAAVAQNDKPSGRRDRRRSREERTVQAARPVQVAQAQPPARAAAALPRARTVPQQVPAAPASADPVPSAPAVRTPAETSVRIAASSPTLPPVVPGSATARPSSPAASSPAVGSSATVRTPERSSTAVSSVAAVPAPSSGPATGAGRTIPPPTAQQAVNATSGAPRTANGIATGTAFAAVTPPPANPAAPAVASGADEAQPSSTSATASALPTVPPTPSAVGFAASRPSGPSTTGGRPEPSTEDSILARIVASISIPASELEVAPVRPPRPSPAASGEGSSAVLDEAAALAERNAEARRERQAARRAAEKKAAEAKELADKKAKDAKALAEKKEAAAAKLLADKKAAAEKKASRAEPARVWVQVAGGATESDLGRAWKDVQAKAPALAGRKGYTTPLRATNRVLTGPFKTQEEAQAFVNQLRKQGVSGFTFSSSAGQKVSPLAGK